MLGRLLVWIIVLGILGYACWLVAFQKEEVKTKSGGRRGGGGAVSIVTATATEGNIGVYIDAIGTVTPVYTASIYSQVTGVLNKVHYDEGQLVKMGDALTEIDSRQYEASLAQAMGALERDQNVLKQAEMDLKRYQEAWSRNAVAKQVLDDQEKLVLQDRGTVKNDQGTVDYDKLQVEYCHITSPITGRVGLRLVDPGNLVMAGASGGSNANPLVVITQLQPITVIFSIPEDNLAQVQVQLRKNAKLAVDVNDRTAQNSLGKGELIALDNQIDTTTGTVKVRASFPNEDFALFPNQFVNARLLVETLQNVTLLPSASIQQNGQTSFVYVIKDHIAHIRNIKTGVTEGGMTQVLPPDPKEAATPPTEGATEPTHNPRSGKKKDHATPPADGAPKSDEEKGDKAKEAPQDEEEGIKPGDVVANSSFNKLRDGDTVVLPGEKPPGGGKKGGAKGEGKSGEGKSGEGKGS